MIAKPKWFDVTFTHGRVFVPKTWQGWAYYLIVLGLLFTLGVPLVNFFNFNTRFFLMFIIAIVIISDLIHLEVQRLKGN